MSKFRDNMDKFRECRPMLPEKVPLNPEFTRLRRPFTKGLLPAETARQIHGIPPTLYPRDTDMGDEDGDGDTDDGLSLSGRTQRRLSMSKKDTRSTQYVDSGLLTADALELLGVRGGDAVYAEDDVDMAAVEAAAEAEESVGATEAAEAAEAAEEEAARLEADIEAQLREKNAPEVKAQQEQDEAAAQQARLTARMVAAKEKRSEEAAKRQEEAKRRKEAAMAKRAQQRGAVQIQAAYRGREARRDVEEKKAQIRGAVRIQAAHRGREARRDMEGTNAVEKAEADLYLGTGAGTGVGEDAHRRAMQGEEQAAVEEDAGQTGAVAVSRDMVAVAATAEEKKAQIRGAVQIQAAHRGREARRDMEEKKAQIRGAVQIQAAHRGREARRDMEEKRKQQEGKDSNDDGNPHPPGWRRELHKKTERQTAPPEEKSGAVRIQAAFRGRQARRDVDEKKKHQRDGNPHPPGWRRDLHTKQVEEKRAQQRGAVKIQAVHRGRKARKDVGDRKVAVQAKAGDRVGGAGPGGQGGKGEMGGKGAKRGSGGKGGSGDKGARRGKRAKGGKGGTGSKRNKGISRGKGGKGAKGGKGKTEAEAAAQQARLTARMVAAKDNRSEEAATRQEEAKRRAEEAKRRRVGARKRREEAEGQASREGQKQLRQKDEALQARIEEAGRWAARE
jgi:hypothetical protein